MKDFAKEIIDLPPNAKSKKTTGFGVASAMVMPIETAAVGYQRLKAREVEV